jgi:hypothetical protein
LTANDEIILIGFSRGAFTVRALASLINDVGVLKGAGRYCLDKVYNLWEKQLAPSATIDPIQSEETPLSRYVNGLRGNGLCRSGTKIKVCAVWDTVAALGGKLPRWLSRSPGTQSRKLHFVNSTLCSNIEHAFQALALDERRFHFQPEIWIEHEESSQTLKQCWFKGSHGDIGGGIQNSCLSNLSLSWMISRLQPFASFNPSKIHHLASDWSILPHLLDDDPNVNKALNPQNFVPDKSYTKFYRLGGSKVRVPGKFLKRGKGKGKDKEKTKLTPTKASISQLAC